MTSRPVQWGQPEASISAREAEVLAALGEHLTNAEIAARLVISVRTVESHVSSLLRKLGVTDRRALAAAGAGARAAAAGAAAAPAVVPAAGGVVPTAGAWPSAAGGVFGVPGVPGVRISRPSPRPVRLPSALTTFIGRAAELAELSRVLRAHRLVTVIGPGGVGKTRLAVRVAAELAGDVADGVCFVDLVPVTDAELVAPAIAAALGLGEHRARTAAETVHAWLADREVLLVLDNCEQVPDGLAVVLERLLVACPRVTVLATGRSRLLVPFERVFAVAGLAVEAPDGARGDAVTLFLERAAAAGAQVSPADLPRVAAVCAELDGTALAIELAAARVPSLGLDGLEAGLADRLRLLAGGSRIADRHRSLRSTLDWSHDLLDDAARAVLRRVSVFAGAFPVAAAEVVVGGWEPVPAGGVPAVLAALADQTLLVPVADGDATRYRALETVRQYGAELLDGAGEGGTARGRHLTWCLDAAVGLDAAADHDSAAWRAAFDDVAVELRAALVRPAAGPEHRAWMHRLALSLADLAFDRGTPGDAQRHYERAAELTDDDAARADALHRAAGAAEVRHLGNEALRLRRAAADARIRAGDRPWAAVQLARAGELIRRGPGMMRSVATPQQVADLLAEASDLAGGDEAARARVLIAEAFRQGGAAPDAIDLARQALEITRRLDDPLAVSAALDALTSIQLTAGEVQEAAASTLQRLELLAPLRMTAGAGLEFADAVNMATDCALAVGDLRGAHRFAEQASLLPFQREEPHLALSRLILSAALAGRWDEALALADRFLEGFERAGRPLAGILTRGAWAAATVCGFRGDAAGRARWLAIVDAVNLPVRAPAKLTAGVVLDGMLLLHEGRFDDALARLSVPSGHQGGWHDGMWRPWHAAVRAEAAVLARLDDAADAIRAARAVAAGSPIALGLLLRAEALFAGDDDGLLVAAGRLEAAGSRYEWARTLALVEGPARSRGEAVLAELGTTPPAPRR